MNQLHKQALWRLYHELEATLTPKQRKLFSVGALNKDMCTAEQTAILEKMTPYLEGRPIEPMKQDAILDIVSEGWESGLNARKNDVGRIIAAFAIAFMVAVFLAIVSR